MVGYTAGTAHHTDESWIRVLDFGVEKMIPKKGYRYNVPNTYIKEKVVLIAGRQWKVRGWNGFTSKPGRQDSLKAVHTKGSEWNRIYFALMGGVTGTVEGVVQPIANYTLEDLNMVYPANGIYANANSVDGWGNLTMRPGYNSISGWNISYNGHRNTSYGWRPILELVE